MILIDTSALYAIASALDPNHARARDLAAAIEEEGQEVLIHTYALSETFALVHRRRGLREALRVDALASAFLTVVVDRSLHDRAVERLRGGMPSRVSLVDAVSLVVMEDRGIDTAFAFDSDFGKAGFRTYGT